MIEFPFCAKLFRNTDRILQVSGNKTFKASVYGVFALVLWLSALASAQPLLIGATTMTLASGLNAASVYRKEGDEGSSALSNQSTWTTAAAGAAIGRV